MSRYFAELDSAGPDWVAAANFRSNIPASAPYVAAQVLATDNTGAPSLDLPTMRQRAMLALLKRYLPEDGDSMRLIKQGWITQARNQALFQSSPA